MSLETLPCPVCKKPLVARAGDVKPAAAFGDCLRRCDSCGVGYSNASRRPVWIYADPASNVPAEVRNGLLDALSRSVNKINRPNKRAKFGFETSEDAVTWTVFRYLQANSNVSHVARASGHDDAPGVDPQLLLWGVKVPVSLEDADGAEARLAEISRRLGEPDDRRTEPDVILDFGKAGLIAIEVKLGSANDTLPADDDRWERYLGPGFRDAKAVKQSGLYELTRNWRFAVELAAGRPFTLVNLGRPALFDDSRMETWSAALDGASGGRFVRMSWHELLGPLTLQAWMAEFCEQRQLLSAAGRPGGSLRGSEARFV